MDDHEKAAREIRDPIERIVAEALDRHGIRYKRDPKMHDLDFHLPDLDILIEAKQFYTNRIWRQLTGRENVVLIQGRQAAEGFAAALKAAAEAEREACLEITTRWIHIHGPIGVEESVAYQIDAEIRARRG